MAWCVTSTSLVGHRIIEVRSCRLQKEDEDNYNGRTLGSICVVSLILDRTRVVDNNISVKSWVCFLSKASRNRLVQMEELSIFALMHVNNWQIREASTEVGRTSTQPVNGSDKEQDQGQLPYFNFVLAAKHKLLRKSTCICVHRW